MPRKKSISSWSSSEDVLLSTIVTEIANKTGKLSHERHKVNWSHVSNQMNQLDGMGKKRTAGACQSRWNVVLDPTVDRSDWTDELDAQLLRLMKDKATPSWSTRAKVLANEKQTKEGEPMRRSGADCCERYFYLMKLKKQELSSTGSGVKVVKSDEDMMDADTKNHEIVMKSEETPTLKRAKKGTQVDEDSNEGIDGTDDQGPKRARKK